METASTEQTVLPGTDEYIVRYRCGHDTSHRIPSEDVGVFKFGVGYVAYCTCGGHDLETAAETPHFLGDHSVLLGGNDLSPAVWLALDDEANGWWETDPDDPGFSDMSSREKRQQHREQCIGEIESDRSEGEQDV